MTKMLEMPAALYESLELVAASSGTTPLGWIACKLAEAPNGNGVGNSKTMADVFRGRIGLVEGAEGTEQLSENTGAGLTAALLQQQKAARL